MPTRTYTIRVNPRFSFQEAVRTVREMYGDAGLDMFEEPALPFSPHGLLIRVDPLDIAAASRSHWVETMTIPEKMPEPADGFMAGHPPSSRAAQLFGTIRN